jgi:hypothetical protein
MKREYLGDGVYATRGDYGDITLTTEDGVRVTNTVVLEREVIGELVRFIATMSGGPAAALARSLK